MQFFHKYIFIKVFSVIFIITLIISQDTYAAKKFHPADTSSSQHGTVENISNDDTEGEDLEIRRAAVKAIGTAAATAVVMDARTGRILTIINQDWGIRRAFKPCSTIKLVTAVAGYNENLIRSNGSLQKGSYRLGLDDALAYSNNAFFQKVGANLGSDKLVYYARKLGLGEKTGINAENETSGTLPYGNENLRIYSHADDFRASALQLAVMVSALTNGGKLLIPKIPRSRIEKTNFRGLWKREIGMPSSVYERVIPGMVEAVEQGTAKRMQKENMRIAGKTGSCIADKTWVGLFVSVAPIENPHFAVVVITKGKYARGKYSAAIAGKIYQALKPRLNEKFNRAAPRRTLVARSAPNPNAKPPADKIIAKNSVAAKDNKSNILNKSPIKLVKTQDSSKLFPTIVITGKPEINRPRIVQN